MQFVKLKSLRKTTKSCRSQNLRFCLFLVHVTFIPAGVAGDLVRIAIAWNMVANEKWAAFAVFIATTTTAQIAARSLVGGLGDVYHPLKLAVLWTIMSGVASAALLLLVVSNHSPSSICFLFFGGALAIGQGAREPLAGTILPKIAPANAISTFIPLRTAIGTCAKIIGPLSLVYSWPR